MRRTTIWMVSSVVALGLGAGCDEKIKAAGTAGAGASGGAGAGAAGGAGAGGAGAGGAGAGGAGAGGAGAGGAGAGGAGMGGAGAGGAGAGGAGAGGLGGMGAVVERGRYLVENVVGCGDCHSPRDAMGAIIPDKKLSGAECFIDTDPTDATKGCLHSRNLTNHATGLQNRTDQQIKDLFQKGQRPDGTALFNVMPYYMFHAFTDQDADAIVAFLRSVPGVDHAVPAHQAPWNVPPPAPSPPFNASAMPDPGPTAAMRERAVRGKYLAITCSECHTKHNPPGMSGPVLDEAKLFAGGEEYTGLVPSPPFPMTITSRNLTSDATGLGGMWTAEQIARALKMGLDKDGHGICPPMPVGPMGALGGLTDDDALDIAYYILSLPPIANTIATQCMVPGT